MESVPGFNESQVSRFLQLPREIRDLIYAHSLVSIDVIPIECAVAKTSSYRPGVQPGTELFTDLPDSYVLRSPWIHRRVWCIPAFDALDLYSHRDHNPPTDLYMTYQIGEQVKRGSENEVDLNLLHVCKQIYAEASKVFYGSNMFSFTSDFRIPTAFAFLCDRPAKSLLLIDSLEFALMEACDMTGTAEARYPITRRSTDSMVLQYAYQYFTELCTLLSTSRTRLRKLHLIVETMFYQGEAGRNDLRENMAWETQRMTSARPWTPLWLDPLLQIDGLESLETHWISNQPRFQRMIDTMDVIQRHMLPSSKSTHTIHALTESNCRYGTLAFRIVGGLDEETRVLTDGRADHEDMERCLDDSASVQDQKIKRFKHCTYCIEILETYGNACASFFKVKST
jgi:hypothetical protein